MAFTKLPNTESDVNQKNHNVAQPDPRLAIVRYMYLYEALNDIISTLSRSILFSLYYTYLLPYARHPNQFWILTIHNCRIL